MLQIHGRLFLVGALFIARCKAKKKNALVSGNAGDEKKSLPGRLQIYFLINLIDFFFKFTLTELLFFVEKQRVPPFIVQREKRLICPNMFASRKPP